jgi:hypothetical protein
MAGRPKKVDDPKYFDVSKPGQAKPVSTSRPVIINHNDAVKDTVINENPATEEVVAAPSVARKVIKPLTSQAPVEVSEPAPSVGTAQADTVPSAPPVKNLVPKQDEDSSEQITVTTTKSKTEKPVTIPGVTDTPTVEAQTESTDSTSAPVSDKAAKESSNDTVKEVESEESKPEVEPENKENTEAEADNTAEVSDAASVDALAEAGEKKKTEQKELEEQQKRDAALQELIDSKKYFVPLSHDSGSRHRHGHGWLAVLALIFLLAAAYFIVDAGLIDIGFDVPFDVLPQ